MVKRLLVFLVILALIVQGSGRLFILINFKIHQAYIARVLCENRDKPEMKCNGTCHLKKELRKSEESERKQQPPNLALREVLLVLPVRTSFDLSAGCALITNQIPFHPDGMVRKGIMMPMFQPPEHAAWFNESVPLLV